MWQTSVQGPKGCVYSVQYKHTSLGSGVLRRNALSHFVEINTKFMLSQIWVLLAHIRPTISAASTLLQGPGGVGIHPSARVSGAAGECQGRAWVSVPCMGICALGAGGLGSIPAPQARGPGPGLEQEEQLPSSAFVGGVRCAQSPVDGFSSRVLPACRKARSPRERVTARVTGALGGEVG